MDAATANNLLLALVGLGVTILVASIPWAFYIGGKLSSIDDKLSLLEEHEKRLDAHDARLTRLEPYPYTPPRIASADP